MQCDSTKKLLAELAATKSPGCAEIVCVLQFSGGQFSGGLCSPVFWWSVFSSFLVVGVLQFSDGQFSGGQFSGGALCSPVLSGALCSPLHGVLCSSVLFGALCMFSLHGAWPLFSSSWCSLCSCRVLSGALCSPVLGSLYCSVFSLVLHVFSLVLSAHVLQFSGFCVFSRYILVTVSSPHPCDTVVTRLSQPSHKTSLVTWLSLSTCGQRQNRAPEITKNMEHQRELRELEHQRELKRTGAPKRIQRTGAPERTQRTQTTRENSQTCQHVHNDTHDHK